MTPEQMSVVKIVCCCTGTYQPHTRMFRDKVEVNGHRYSRWAWYCDSCGRMQGDKEDRG